MNKNIVIINGSPKADKGSASHFLSNIMIKHINGYGDNVSLINARYSLMNKSLEADYLQISKADAIIFVFPLYIFCLPGILMRYLQDFYRCLDDHSASLSGIKVYACVNCGFPEANINEEAVRVIKSFSIKTGASFRFGIMVGGGGMISSTLHMSYMKKTKNEFYLAISSIANDLESSDMEYIRNTCVNICFPSSLYNFMGGRGWRYTARKNGLKSKDLYKKPYEVSQ